MTKSKILVVDDSKTYLHFAVGALEKAGYNVLSADNAWVTNIVSREHPDLILMDVQLGSVSGVAAVGVLRKRSFCEGIKIFLHSSESPSTLADMAKACGADGFLPKDGREDSLLQNVRKILQPLAKQVGH